METAYTVSTYLIKKLHECGVKDIFGIPGDYVLGLYDRFIRSKTLGGD
jgi:TPP-dependent 2-oxoacid decarboxylase